MNWEEYIPHMLISEPYMIMRTYYAFPIVKNEDRIYLALRKDKDAFLVIGSTGYDTSKEAKEACEKDARSE